MCNRKRCQFVHANFNLYLTLVIVYLCLYLMKTCCLSPQDTIVYYIVLYWSYLHECTCIDIFSICIFVHICMIICDTLPVNAVHGDHNLVEAVSNIRPVISEIEICLEIRKISPRNLKRFAEKSKN